jgi:hypothetical protein
MEFLRLLSNMCIAIMTRVFRMKPECKQNRHVIKWLCLLFVVDGFGLTTENQW